MLRIGMLLVLTGWLALTAACNQAIDAQGGRGLEIGTAVQLLSTTQGDLAEQARRRLLGHGRSALPFMEAALHRATPAGRRNLVVALRRLELAESMPLLGHVAAYDTDLATAREAFWTLRLWASQTGRSRPQSWAVSARDALRKPDEVRGMGALLLDP